MQRLQNSVIMVVLCICIISFSGCAELAKFQQTEPPKAPMFSITTHADGTIATVNAWYYPQKQESPLEKAMKYLLLGWTGYLINDAVEPGLTDTGGSSSPF